GRGRMSNALIEPAVAMRGAGIEEMPEAIRSSQYRPRPGRPIVPCGTGRGGERGAEMRPVDEVATHGVSLRHVAVSQLRIAKRLRRLEEIDVPVITVAGEPEIPDPMIDEGEHQFSVSPGATQPLMPVEAIEEMK